LQAGEEVVRRSFSLRKVQEVFVPFLTGFLLCANFYLVPLAEKTPRASDILGALAAVCCIWWLLSGQFHKRVFWLFLYLGAFFTFWAWLAWSSDWLTTFVLSIRWLAALPLAYVIYVLTEYSPAARVALAYGFWFGAAFNVLVLGFQFFGFKEFTQNIGLAAQDSATSYVYGIFRTPGMHAHPNGAAAVASFGIVAGLYLVSGERKSLVWLILAIALLFVAGAFTFTRSAILMSALTLALVFVSGVIKRKTIVLKLFAGLGIGLLFLWLLGPPGGWERWLDADNINFNSAIRFSTNLLSLTLITEHPLGIGWEATKEILGATHNAFLHLALNFGVLPALLALFSMLNLALSVIKTRISLEGLVALHSFLLFFWEEHYNNPLFIFISCWFFVIAVQQAKIQLGVLPLPRGTRGVIQTGNLKRGPTW
jgi:hypothetical protein